MTALPEAAIVKQPRPVIFLDIDGVMRTDRSSHPHAVHQLKVQMPSVIFKQMAFDPVAIACLNTLCERTNGQLVAVTAWRSNNNLRKILRKAGVTGQFHSDWRTPNLSHEPSLTGGFDVRGREIDAWLARNPDVTRWVWLDDMPDYLPHQEASFIHVNQHMGLSPHDTDSALEVLGYTPERPKHVRANDNLHAAETAMALAQRHIKR